jgi:hypothetical protein
VILAAVVTSVLPGVVAYHRPCLLIARSAGVDDVVGITVLSLSARIKNPLHDRHSVLVGRLPYHAVCMDGCLLALRTTVILALPCWHMQDVELSACCMAACSMCACASRCRFHALGIKGVGMARSSVTAVMSF